MVNGGDRNETFGGLAKRWLKNQLQVHGDPRRAYRERQESEAIEERMKEKAQEDVGRAVFNTFAPAGLKEKLAGMERYKQEQERQVEERRQAEYEARPRAAVELALTGAVNGRLSEAMPLVLNRPETAGEALALELSPLAESAIGDRPFQAFMFAIPGYTGAGQYDLNAIAHTNGTDDWDPFWFQLILDSDGEPFYWTADYGRAVITVDADERTIRVRMPMENAGSERVDITATVTLP
jgi:hypothetical protein